MNQLNASLVTELTEAIAYCPLRLQPALKRRLAELTASTAAPTALATLQEKIRQGIAESEQRLAARPAIHYPDLPVSQEREKIKTLLSKHPIVVIAGETGSGKTTQLPKICLELGRGILGVIGHTQPRRIAARNVACAWLKNYRVRLARPLATRYALKKKSPKTTISR